MIGSPSKDSIDRVSALVDEIEAEEGSAFFDRLKKEIVFYLAYIEDHLTKNEGRSFGFDDAKRSANYRAEIIRLRWKSDG